MEVNKKMEEKEQNNTFRSVEKSDDKKNKGLLKNVFVSFASGLIGASLIIGTCFGVPEIKSKIIGETKGYEETKQTSTKLDNSTQINATAISLEEYSNTSIGVASKVLPSIVGIEIEYEVNSIFGKTTSSAKGSGIIISEDGYILTNNHVVSTNSSTSQSSYYQVSNAVSTKVKLYNDENVYEAKIIGTDDQTDLAVIKIDKTGLSVAEFGDSDSVKIGEFAMAIGNPLGLEASATSGIISGVNREITTTDNIKYTAIQTDAAINSGNSGGALVNSQGQVIGVNTLKIAGNGVEGIGFAIPINDTKDIMKQLIENKKVVRPYIGIKGRTLDEETAKRYNLVEGVYVQEAEDFASAQKAGIKGGDVITEVAGEKVKTVEEITKIRDNYQIGDKLMFKIYRNGEYRDIEVTLSEAP